ncbi:C45 family peptidase [Streptomyces zaehneri]|uniref:C45 family peptidase n=1 Tax=Streptomyces zaehneri TaxID=3051180 RepID=UPI0028D2B133|nr:C45 family peptidase [Streptomyces sp. DSM 40713]
MGHYVKTFHAIEIGDGADGRCAAHVRSAMAKPEDWLTDEGRTPEGAAQARQLFETHMPELVPVLDRLAEQLKSPQAKTLLTMATVRPFFSGCTQIGHEGTLLRNYDFAPDHCEGIIVSSRFLRPVVGMQEAGWGLLDGMNDAGLAVSLTFGGRFVHGPGFAMPLVLRYLLETCRTVDEAVGGLRTLPVAIPQNVTLVDPDRSVTVHVGPDIPMTEAPDSCAANHQHLPVPDEQERTTRTGPAGRRTGGGNRCLGDAATTVVPARVRPLAGHRVHGPLPPCRRPVTYHWPGEHWEHTIAGFTPGARTVALGLSGDNNDH